MGYGVSCFFVRYFFNNQMFNNLILGNFVFVFFFNFNFVIYYMKRVIVINWFYLISRCFSS